MYEELTKYLPILGLESFSESSFENRNNKFVEDFRKIVYAFVNDHENLSQTNYEETLEKNGLPLNSEVMSQADVSAMEDRTVMAMLMRAISLEHFSNGALLEFFKKGCIQKWLLRLKEIDLANARRDIIRIIIESGSGYTSAEYAYHDKLTITRDKIDYENKPYIGSDKNPHRKWSYRSNNPDFGKLYDQLVNAVFDLIHRDETWFFVCDAGSLEFTVTYTDKTKDKKSYTFDDDDFEDCYSALRKMIPSFENMPFWIRSDDADIEVEEEC